MVISASQQSEVRVFQRPLIESPKQALAVEDTLSYTFYHNKIATKSACFANRAIFFISIAFVFTKKNYSYQEGHKAA